MTSSRGRGVPKARRTQPSRIAVHAQSDEGGVLAVLAVRRPKSRGRTPGTRTKLGEAERRFWRGGRLRRPQQAAFLRCALARTRAGAEVRWWRQEVAHEAVSPRVHHPGGLDGASARVRTVEPTGVIVA